MNDKLLVGTWAEIPTPYVTDILSSAGLDFSIIDFEHGCIDFETAQNMIFAAHGRNKKAFIRVPSIEESWILRSLDMGCDGMIFPQVTSVNDVKKIIQLTKYHPVGNRGFNPYIASSCYRNKGKSFYEKQNNEVQLGVILEDKTVFDNLDEILEYPQIDIYYIGQYDLSMSLGVAGDVSHPLVLSYMEQAVKKIRAKDKMAGCMVHSVGEAQQAIEQGFNFIVYKVDSGLLYQVCSDFIEGIK